MQTKQQNNNIMNTTTKVIVAVLAIVTLGLSGYIVKLHDDIDTSKEIIKSLSEEIHRSDELLLKTHKDYHWGLDEVFAQW